MLQNMLFVAGDVVKQPFIGGFAQFYKRTEIRRGKVAVRTAMYERFYMLSVGFIGEPPPGAGGILQFGDDDRPIDSLQCGIIHAVRAQDIEGIPVHCLCARADDVPQRNR